MGRSILYTVVLFLIFVTPAGAGDFRGSIWGDREAAVLERETSGVLSEQNPAKGVKVLIFNDQVAGLDTFVIYLLDHDRLVETKYLFPQQYIQSNRFLEDFAKVEEELRRKYGKPVESGDFWRDGALDKTVALGNLVAVGELTLKSRWETDDTVITHVLKGESLDIDHEINYISKRYSKGTSGVMKGVRRPLRF